MAHGIHGKCSPCRGNATRPVRIARVASYATLALSATACGSLQPAPPPEQATTLAAFTQDGDLEVSLDQAGHLTGTLGPWIAGVLELATSCPRLDVNVTVNGLAVGLVERGSGTQISGPMPVFRCALPAFAATVDVARGSALDIHIWDSTADWRMHADFIAPTATLVESDGLRIGTWAHVDLVPVTDGVRVMFQPGDGGAGNEAFSIESTRTDGGCSSTAVVDPLDGGVLTTDVGVPCPLTFTDSGIAFFVPSAPVGPGRLSITGWPDNEVTQCLGTAYCKLSTNDVGTQAPPVAVIDTSVAQ